VVSPFEVGTPAHVSVEVVAAGAAAGAAASPSAPFSEGGSFASQGNSPFPAAGSATAEAQAQMRAEALVRLRGRLEAQKLKHGAVAAEAKALREAAKAPADLGGDKVVETELRAFTKETDVEKALVDALKAQTVELEGAAFGKSQAAKARPGPFFG
jgi:hypothetical protein